jgi:SnoaL-like domain
VAKPDRQRVRFSFHPCVRLFDLGFLSRPTQINQSILKQMNTLKYAFIAIAHANAVPPAPSLLSGCRQTGDRTQPGISNECWPRLMPHNSNSKTASPPPSKHTGLMRTTSLFREDLAAQSKKDGNRSAAGSIGLARSFHRGHTHERIVANANGDLGYVVQIEHLRFHVPGQAKKSTRDYRVTMIFRREAEGWRIVHRQADSQMVKQAPQ